MSAENGQKLAENFPVSENVQNDTIINLQNLVSLAVLFIFICELQSFHKIPQTMIIDDINPFNQTEKVEK
jgi:hypothetical protein